MQKKVGIWCLKAENNYLCPWHECTLLFSYEAEVKVVQNCLGNRLQFYF